MSQPTIEPTVQPEQPLAKPGFRGWTPSSSSLNPYIPPAFITLILLVGHFSFGILESFQRTLLAIVSSMVCELVLGRLIVHKWPNLASSYITGISVGILLRSPAYWPYMVCALLSITSKYVLRVKGRHLFNPSNFGISAMLFLASDAVATLSIQWGNNLAAMAVIWVLTFIVGLGHFAHCIATSGEILAAVLSHGLSAGAYFHWLLPATLGNIAGGVILVTLLEYGQVKLD